MHGLKTIVPHSYSLLQNTALYIPDIVIRLLIRFSVGVVPRSYIGGGEGRRIKTGRDRVISIRLQVVY